MTTSKIWIMLDMNGVMFSYPNGPGPQPEFFSPFAIQALKHLLNEIPEAVICLTSDMRYSQQGMSKMERLFKSSNLPWDRVKGETRIFDFTSKHRREELIDFCQNHMAPEDFVAIIDDEAMEDIKYFKIDPRLGLMMSDAVQILMTYRAGVANDKSLEEGLTINWSMSGFGPTYIKPSNHEL